MKNRNLLLVLVFIAILPLSLFGCYTQLAERTTEGGTAIRNERALPQSDDRDVNAQNSDQDTRNVENDNYDDGDEEVPPEFGLKARQYDDDWYSETEYADGKTIINNFYYDGYYRTNPWYAYRYRPGWGYDSYYWDPYPSVYVGFGWGYGPWRSGWYAGWNWGYDGWWVDPYPGWWDDPWYYHAWWPNRYGGWYAYGWDRYHHYGHGDDYYHGGGGGGGHDGDNYDSGRKYRQDRYAGFGTSRDAGGVVTAGGGSSNNGNTTEKTTTTRTIRRDGRSGFGSSGATRRETGVESGTTEKTSSTSTTTRRSGTSNRYENQDGSTVRQRTDSGLIIRRSRSTGDQTSADDVSRPVLENGDRQYRMNDRSGNENVTRIESPDATGNTNDSNVRQSVRTRSVPWTVIRRSSQKTAAETETSSSDNTSAETRSGSTTRQNTENAERSTQRETRSDRSVERSSSRSGSQPSYSSPSGGSRSSASSGGSRSSGSGRSSGGSSGGGSRSSGGSRRR